MKMKGQAAMEYLMTYGWAIIIIIVAVAALYAMGVFNIGGQVTCSPCFSNFAYVDYAAGTLLITNGPEEINVTAVTGGTLTGGLDQIFDPGEQLTFTGIATTGDVDISITYTKVDSGLSHSDSATIRQ